VYDFVRIFSSPDYSIFRNLLKSVLREKEVISVGPQVLLVLGALTSFFGATIGLYSYEIAVSATLTACIADGFVAVLGRRFGKHKIHVFTGEEKSIEGFIIGFISSYLCSMIIIGPFYALFAAIIFVLLDIFSSHIADNLLNPIFLALGVWVVSVIFNIPIGWVHN
jgi:dolichol kinase